IISATAQALLNVIVFDTSAGDAVAKRRVHNQWDPDSLAVEPTYAMGRLWTDHARVKLPDRIAVERFRAAMSERGTPLSTREVIGEVQLIRRSVEGDWHGASDPRKGGKPAAY
ncbi:MAG TPA: gamma-glutamyltransferase, partial [Phycisphaerales bacterium]|nr:gamma-glutamyltransferase [Phycisphaerales bacterium]